ncbi:ENR1 protein, partial [Ramphastos sulfuratus]|nr:ENR1 protein [Ramphastos sulfuratus]
PLNHIIQLQGVLEMVTNKTSDALTLLAKQNSKTRASVYQNPLALGYLLNQEGKGCVEN